jgi:hypothetical protein
MNITVDMGADHNAVTTRSIKKPTAPPKLIPVDTGSFPPLQH